MKSKCPCCQKELPNRRFKYCSAKCNILFNVKKDPKTDCWLWQKSKYLNGYGKITVNGKYSLAHRVSYKVFVGEIPKKICVCHSCDIQLCLNPKHLWLGTQQDNITDKMVKGRFQDQRGERNPSNKLTNKKVLEIRKFLNEGKTHKEIAKFMEIGLSTVSYIRNKLTWSHI